jgi:lipid-A-disaccharide synthase
MIVAGEPSGDAHAAALVRALREECSPSRPEFFGSTGALMREEGVESIVHADDLAIMGIVEVAGALPKFWRAFRELKRAARQRRPDAVILVDWPEFNLRLARSLHRAGIRVVYYISPQLWAWRPYRVRSIRRHVDLLLSILPFESQWYSKRGISKVEFVGHPLTGQVRARYGREEFCRRNNLNPSLPIVALLPGSRPKEVERILPPLMDAAARIAEIRPEVQFVVALAPGRSRHEVTKIVDARLNGLPSQERLRVTQHETVETLAAADAAAVASGTATLEAALVGTPLVIVYKESPINWHLLGRLITSEHLGLVNLVAGRRLALEIIQGELNGDRLARELTSLLEPEKNAAMREELARIASALGSGGASRRAAQAVLRFLKKS